MPILYCGKDISSFVPGIKWHLFIHLGMYCLPQSCHFSDITPHNLSPPCSGGGSELGQSRSNRLRPPFHRNNHRACSSDTEAKVNNRSHTHTSHLPLFSSEHIIYIHDYHCIHHVLCRVIAIRLLVTAHMQRRISQSLKRTLWQWCVRD